MGFTSLDKKKGFFFFFFFEFSMRLPHNRLFNIITFIRRVAVFFGITFCSYVDVYVIIFVFCCQLNLLRKELPDFKS
jgi:hypothetical protein